MIKDNKILISEIFESIDGEGYHAGYATVFFRTIACNLRCVWCDSKYTFEAEENSKWYSVQEAVDAVESFGIKHITITGGEPLLEENQQWMQKFCEELLPRKYEIDFETNGAIDYTEMLGWREDLFVDYQHRVHFIMDWKCPSSKMNSKMLKENLTMLNFHDLIKCVVTDEDFVEVERLLKIVPREVDIYLSPCFGKVTMEKIPEFILQHKENTNLRAQIQIHKVFWNPNKRGV